MNGPRSPRQSVLQILLIPAILAILTLAGLIVGLLGDGIEDVIACAAIALPVAMIALHHRRSKRG